MSIITENEIIQGKKIAGKQNNIWGYDTKVGQIRNDRRAQKILGRISSDCRNKPILELGCGNGEYTRRFMAYFSNLYAVDISNDLLSEMERSMKSRVKVSTGDAHNLNFENNYFSAVVGNAALHHFNVDKALCEIYRVLQPAGQLIFAEPNMLNPIIWLERNIPVMRKRSQTSPNETAFIRWKLKNKLEEHGFSKITIVPFDFIHPKLNYLTFRLLKSILLKLETILLIKEFSGSLLICARKV